MHEVELYILLDKNRDKDSWAWLGYDSELTKCQFVLNPARIRCFDENSNDSIRIICHGINHEYVHKAILEAYGEHPEEIAEKISHLQNEAYHKHHEMKTNA